MDLTMVNHTISKLAERQGQTEQHQDKFKREIKPIIKKDRGEITRIRQDIHQHLTEHKVNSKQQMEHNEHLIHKLFATKFTTNVNESVNAIEETTREKCKELTYHHQELTDKLTETGELIQSNLQKLGNISGLQNFLSQKKQKTFGRPLHNIWTR